MKKTTKMISVDLARLALFFFLFLSLEYYYDTMLGSIVVPSQVVLGQGTILGASVLGFGAFCLYPRLRHGLRLALNICCPAIILACAVLLCHLTDSNAFQATGCIAFFFLGFIGGYAHWRIALQGCANGHIAFCVGLSYAMGIALQTILLAVCSAFAFAIPGIAVGMLAFIVSCFMAEMKDIPIVRSEKIGHANIQGDDQMPSDAAALGSQASAESSQHKQLAWSVAIVALLSVMFITLDNMITLTDAEGTVNVAGLPRLLLALSALCAGFLYDIRNGRFTNIIMFCVVLVSTITILAFEANSNHLLPLVFFYITSGFFVIYFTTRFIVLAPKTNAPAFWASMGRMINNICAFGLSWLSLILIETATYNQMMIASIAILAFTSIAFFASGAFNLSIAKPSAACSDEGHSTRKSIFVKTYGLTPREAEVLGSVTSSEKPLKAIAAEMDISLRMLQKHLTSIYQKTDTQTRAGLTKKYMSEIV